MRILKGEPEGVDHAAAGVNVAFDLPSENARLKVDYRDDLKSIMLFITYILPILYKTLQ